MGRNVKNMILKWFWNFRYEKLEKYGVFGKNPEKERRRKKKNLQFNEKLIIFYCKFTCSSFTNEKRKNDPTKRSEQI